MSTDDRKKILGRIEKCLKLANSSEPHEAAAAMRQAQKLMAAHSISEQELFGNKIESELVITPEPWKVKLPLYMAHIVGLIQTAFGVQAIIMPAYDKNGKCKLGVKYYGPCGRPQLAAYTHVILFRQSWKAWYKFLKQTPHLANQRGGRMGFVVGWVNQVRSQVIAFGYVPADAPTPTTPEQHETHNALVVKLDNEMTLTRKEIEREHQDLQPSKNNSMPLSGRAVAAGREAAKDFSLHRPMDGAKQRQLSHH